jgi:hypothetical protein
MKKSFLMTAALAAPKRGLFFCVCGLSVIVDIAFL